MNRIPCVVAGSAGWCPLPVWRPGRRGTECPMCDPVGRCWSWPRPWTSPGPRLGLRDKTRDGGEIFKISEGRMELEQIPSDELQRKLYGPDQNTNLNVRKKADEANIVFSAAEIKRWWTERMTNVSLHNLTQSQLQLKTFNPPSFSNRIFPPSFSTRTQISPSHPHGLPVFEHITRSPITERRNSTILNYV